MQLPVNEGIILVAMRRSFTELVELRHGSLTAQLHMGTG